VLQGFLDRPRIYGTDFFVQRFEAQARSNLSNALKALQDGKIYA
jgi:predicted metal-dependent HD superfamily phosphohydrolase